MFLAIAHLIGLIRVVQFMRLYVIFEGIRIDIMSENIMTSASNPENEANPEVGKQKKPRRMSNLILRLITGLVLLPIIIIVVRLGRWPLTIVLGFLMFNGILEFYFMERRRGLQNNVIIGMIAALMILLAFHYQIAILWQLAVIFTIVITFAIEFARGREFKPSVWRIATTVFGIFYVAFPLGFFIAIRQTDWGFHWFFAALYTTWGTDTFAYIFGNMFGKTKLAPVLSPNKTVEGAVGGLLFGAVLPIPVMLQVGYFSWPAVIMFVIATFVAVGGDLLESAIKRYFDIKDSHVPGFNIFPGHGGVLDRIDSALAVAPIYYIFLILIGEITLLI